MSTNIRFKSRDVQESHPVYDTTSNPPIFFDTATSELGSVIYTSGRHPRNHSIRAYDHFYLNLD